MWGGVAPAAGRSVESLVFCCHTGTRSDVMPASASVFPTAGPVTMADKLKAKVKQGAEKIKNAAKDGAQRAKQAYNERRVR